MNRNVILFGFIVLKFILQYLLISPQYDLHRDEYLHLDQANHLAWGYISVPPLSSWIAYIIRLLGNGIFWIKFFPALFGALTILVVWRTIEELKGNLFALILASAALLVSVMLRINILFQPNSSDIFFWTLVYFTIVKYISTKNPQWLLAMGIAVAFGFLSKYNIVFLLIGLLPAILTTEHRNVLLNKYFYGALGLAFIIVLPNLYWQVKNDFPTLHQLRELQETQLVNVKTPDFLKEQFLYFLSSIFVLFAAFISFFIYRPFRSYRIIFWSFVFTFSIFVLLKAKAYYTIGLYPILYAFGSVYLEKVFSTGWKRILRPISVAVVLGGSILFILIAFPFQGPEQIQKDSERYKEFGLLRWEDGKDHNMPQDFADMLGWSDLARKVDSVYTSLPEKTQTLVLCDNYGQAGAINYYSKFKNINAVSMNADYINWIPLDKPILHVILIQQVNDDDPGRKKEIPLFESVELVGENTNPFSREKGTKIYLLKTAKTDINKIIRAEIEENRY